MFTFGGGEHGQLGHGDKVNKIRPTLVEALDGVFISQITCGWSHSVALTSKGRVYTWGNGDHGKLGHGSGKKVSTPQMVEKLKDIRVVKIASYNEHTAALIEPLDDSGNFCSSFGTNSVPVSSAYVKHMKEMVNDPQFSDVTFIVDDREIYAHRSILASRCEHFDAMFRSGMRESHESRIPLPNVSYDVFLLILEYLYTDSVKIDIQHAVELYIVAEFYQIDRLKEMSTLVVKRNLNGDNAADLLQAAHENHCLHIKDLCMEFIVANFDLISKSEGIKVVSHALLLEILSLRP